MSDEAKDEWWHHVTTGVDAFLSLGPTPLQKGLADGTIVMTEYPIINLRGERVMVQSFWPAKWPESEGWKHTTLGKP